MSAGGGRVSRNWRTNLIIDLGIGWDVHRQREVVSEEATRQAAFGSWMCYAQKSIWPATVMNMRDKCTSKAKRRFQQD